MGGRRGVFTQVAEDPLGCVGLGDGGDDTHAAVTTGAGERVDEKDPAQKLGPREAVPRGRLRSGAFPRRHRGLWSWNDLRPVASGRGKDAVEANDMFAGARDERQESLDELERGEHDRLGPVGKRALEP